MKRYIIAYVVGLMTMLALDACWLMFVGPILYWPRIGAILLDQPVIWASVAFYLIYQAGVLVLAVRQGWRAGSAIVATRYGAVLGFVAYATYDLTNNATLRLWSTTITVADIAWGTILTAVAATTACAASRRFGD
jgi:uncharacterized membrane protein